MFLKFEIWVAKRSFENQKNVPWVSGTSIWGVSTADWTGNHPSCQNYEFLRKVILSPVDLSNVLQKLSREGRGHVKAPAVPGGLQLVKKKLPSDSLRTGCTRQSRSWIDAMLNS